MSLAGKKKLNRVLEILEEEEFYCSDYKELNDPMEGIYKQSGLKGDVLKEIYDAKQKFKVCSFSEFKGADTQEALPMWAHYANNFCGCAIEIEVKDNLINNHDAPILEVKYLSEVDYKDRLKKLKEEGMSAEEIAKEILRTKLEGWKYENEYRFIKSSSGNYHTVRSIKAIWVYEDGRANSRVRRKRRIAPKNYKALYDAIRRIEKAHGRKYEIKKIDFRHFAE